MPTFCLDSQGANDSSTLAVSAQRFCASAAALFSGWLQRRVLRLLLMRAKRPTGSRDSCKSVSMALSKTAFVAETSTKHGCDS